MGGAVFLLLAWRLFRSHAGDAADPRNDDGLYDVRAGARDAVVVYNLDRLTRRPIELETFRDVCERAGVRDVATVTADIDMGTDDGLLMARVIAASLVEASAQRQPAGK